MARPLRIEQAGGWYHVGSRGVDQRKIFLDDIDRRHWMELLAEAADLYHWIIHSYVLMENHFHTITEIQETNLSAGMQWLNTSYSMWFNRRRRRVGPLLQGRYKAVLVDPREWGLELSRYLHLNPIRLQRFGLDKAVRQADRVDLGTRPTRTRVQQRLDHLRAYRWSSYRAYVGWEAAPAWLETRTVLSLIGGGSLKQQRQAYRDHVEQAIRQGLMGSPWEHLQGQLVLGDELWETIRRKVTGTTKRDRERPQTRSLIQRPPIQAVIDAVEGVKGESWRDFRGRHGDWGRDLVLWLGRRHSGLRLKALGEAVGGLDYAAVSVAVKRMTARLKKDKSLARIAAKVEKELLHFDSAEEPN